MTESFTLTWKEKQDRVSVVLGELCITDDQVAQIRKVFEDEMHLGLAKDQPKKSSLQMENTYIPELCNGREEGEFLALDLGGTNFRVILLKLKPGYAAEEQVKYYTVPEHLRLGKGVPLFDFLAACIFDFMHANGLLEEKLKLGFCFSFPMTQKSLDTGILVTWTKSFNCPDVVGKDAAEMLRDAIKRRSDISVDVCAVVNDTTGTLMKGAYEDQRCAIGLVLGTGCNACYLEKVSCIEKWIGAHPGVEEVVIDIEWGAFGDNGVLDFIKTEQDKQVDANSLLVGSFTFEKLFAGKFIGELVRLTLLKLNSLGVLFSKCDMSDLKIPSSLTAACVSSIALDTEEQSFSRTMQNLEYLGVTNPTIEDIELVKQVCAIVSARGALLVSICLASLLERMDKSFVTIAVDGSLYREHPTFQYQMTEYIKELAPNKKFTFMLADDGSGKGAGLSAAVANRLDTSVLHA